MTDHPERPDPNEDPAASLSPAPHPGLAAPAADATQRLDTSPTQQIATGAAAGQQYLPPGQRFGPPVSEPAYAAPTTAPEYGPPPAGPVYGAEGSGYAPLGAAYPPGPQPPGEQPGTPARRRRGAGLLVGAAGIGLVAGLLGGAGAYLVGDRITGTSQQQSPLPAPAQGVTSRPEGSIASIAAKALPGVVTVRVRGSDGTGTGSGFVIDGNGHILTNNHVIASSAGSGTITVDLSDGTTLETSIVGRDAAYDLAVLKAQRTDLPALTFGRSADVVVGDGVIAVGAPLGLDATVTSGIVSALDRPVAAGGGDETSFINAIQTDAAINPGNSGGPLLDMNGKVIGVNTAIARVPGSTNGTGGNIGVGFAIPSDQAYKTAEQLIKTGKAVHPVIGVRLDRQYDGSGAKLLDSGGVNSGSAAAEAGLQDGDVIVGFEGRRITDPDQLVVAIRSRNVGETVRLEVDRDGQKVELTLTLRPDS